MLFTHYVQFVFFKDSIVQAAETELKFTQAMYKIDIEGPVGYKNGLPYYAQVSLSNSFKFMKFVEVPQ